MCFAPQRRALFQHLNFQKWSGAGVLCTFWLQNVLRATTACTFSTSQLPKVVRQWCVLYILTSKCASRHNGVQIFISHLASWLRTRRFSEPTFRPSGATVFRDFPTFSRICICFLLTLSLLIFSLLIFLFSLPLPCSAFHLSILSEVWLLNFLRTCVCARAHDGYSRWEENTHECCTKLTYSTERVFKKSPAAMDESTVHWCKLIYCSKDMMAISWTGVSYPQPFGAWPKGTWPWLKLGTALPPRIPNMDVSQNQGYPKRTF